MSDEIKLILAAQKGDTEAFAQIVEKYQSLVCAVTFSHTSKLDVSQDLAQETFISAWQNLNTLTKPSGFRPWLVRIAKNKLNSYYRKKSPTHLDPSDMTGISDTRQTPPQTLITQEETIMLEKAMQQIPVDYREPIVLYYRQGKSIRQVAEVMNLSETTVQTRLHRARQMLRDQMAVRVENALEKTVPNKAFTTAVIAAITGTTIKGAATAAAISTAAVTGTSGPAAIGISAILSPVAAKIAATIIVAAAVTVGSVTAYKNSKQNNNPEPQPTVATLTEKTTQPEPQQASQTPHDIDTIAYSEQIPENAIIETPTNNEQINYTQIERSQPPQNTIVEDIDSFNGDIITIKVIDKDTNLPIPYAPIRTYAGNASYYNTDADGIFEVKIPDGSPQYINLFTQPEGYVWQSFSCGEGRFTDYFPEEVVFKLEPGITVGGIVHDPSGNPIEGADISFGYTKGVNDDQPGIDLRYTQKTDADGKWQCTSAPKNLELCKISTSHPNYAAVTDRPKDNITAAELKEQTHILTLRKPFNLSGTVTDTMGNPIYHAKIQLGIWYGDDSPDSRTYTDLNGYYYFGNRNNDEQYITVTAEGFAPEADIYTIKDANSVVDFILDEGSTIYGCVVDEDGNAIADATVRADNWWYDGNNYSQLRSLDWNTKTDNQGKFIFEHAPEEVVQFRISKTGFMTLETELVKPSDQQYQFTIYDKLRVSGQVIDKVTQKPITEFIFRRYEGGFISDPKKITDAQGKFSTAFDDQGSNYKIEFQADGYKPMYSEQISLGQQDVELIVEMVPDTGINGILVDVNDIPIAGATVIIPRSLYLKNMSYTQSSLESHRNTVTDTDGKFHLDSIASSSFSLLVLQDEGYVYVKSQDFPADGKFVLQPYGKIVGNYYIGSKPAANQQIRLDYPDITALSINYKVMTDQQGNFVFDRLIQGRARILIDPYIYVGITAGQTEEVYIGGDGLTVTGQILKPDGTLMDEDFGSCSLTMQPIYENFPIPDYEWPLPDDFESMSYYQAMQWYTDFIGNNQQWVNEMLDKYKLSSQYYNLKADSSGSFEQHNVKPGTYLLSVSVRPWLIAKTLPGGPAREIDYDAGYIASGTKVVTVPEYHTLEEMDIPVDAGRIKCSVTSINVGAQAPDFEIDNLKSEGKIRLSDYIGKTLLINFYNPVLEDIEPEKMQILEDICLQTGSMGNIEILNVAIDTIPSDFLRDKLISECTLNGLYGVAQMHNSRIYQDYKISELPMSVLIDTDGRILYKGTPSPELFNTVTEPTAGN